MVGCLMVWLVLSDGMVGCFLTLLSSYFSRKTSVPYKSLGGKLQAGVGSCEVPWARPGHHTVEHSWHLAPPQTPHHTVGGQFRRGWELLAQMTISGSVH